MSTRGPAGRASTMITVRPWLSSPRLSAIGIMSLALLIVGPTWVNGSALSSTRTNVVGTSVLVLGLVAAIAVAYRFPIYIRHNTKICVFSVPAYLLAIFFMPPLAAVSAGLGVFAGEMLVRSRHANDLSDVVIHTGRWIVLVWLASVVAHAALPTSLLVQHTVLFVAAAAVLWTGDILTVPLAIAPFTHERIDRIVLTCVRGGGPAEAAQYAVGIAGAMIISWHAWALVLLVVPTIFVYLLNRKELDLETLQLLESMADAVDLRDPYTVEHSRRVVEVTEKVLHELGRTGQEAALIVTAARVHDIGKSVVSDAILLRQGSLTAEDRSVMEMHVEHGAELLKRYPDFARMVAMVRHHHERWDGTGYPSCLSRTDIPFGARVIAVADAFVAMTSDRSFRSAVPLTRVSEILRDGRGRQWDPQVVDALLRSVPETAATTTAAQDGSAQRHAAPSPATV